MASRLSLWFRFVRWSLEVLQQKVLSVDPHSNKRDVCKSVDGTRQTANKVSYDLGFFIRKFPQGREKRLHV